MEQSSAARNLDQREANKMSALPPEILEEILSISLLFPESRSPLMSVSSLFFGICQKVVYTQLRFTSRSQLSSFIATYSATEFSVPYLPRTLELDIPGPESHLVFVDLHVLLSQCLAAVKEGAERDNDGRLCLELLRLRLNSHAFDFRIEMVYDALSLVNPRRFIWTGPDPPHHFSIAIVPQAIPHLFRALASYTNLTHLTLAHLTMTSALSCGLPIIPSLQTLRLGQVIFLDPSTVVKFIFDPELKNLEKVHLIDAYTDSIWGPRLRRSDIETAANPGSHIPQRFQWSEEAFKMTQGVIRDIVICEAKTERIIGGDRVENHTILI